MRVLRRPTEDSSVQREYVNSTVHHEQGHKERGQRNQVDTDDPYSDDDSVVDSAPPIVMSHSRTDFEPGVSDESTLNPGCVELPPAHPGHTSTPGDPSEDDPGLNDECTEESRAGRSRVEGSMAI
ncbi:hypothetical protein PF005_g22618 [Phytophthora fragariae]|uniref:Uncharacterized protein n=1 Tax=Phytophthora fragariae TaxID=53985 RepID=A0A6A3IXF7_9STRA|nr:hypothetical protein PF009_g23407 [Phytophthora fragariae]KAE8984053.1 hypothetical protein PF011_g20930 [Phytophthora fragariae]KAE9082683.1 hypothetical protein PF010_g21491 [Phytophthora fragariae]KAE9105471.1 hypothetical protein PF006_g21638 [Phytophthora fragariae]KAE9182094.1 hypothetical protein PF005_g22618 [Phytophthora fragariae]